MTGRILPNFEVDLVTLRPPMLAIFALVSMNAAVKADGIKLGEAVKAGDCFRCELTLKIEGKLKDDSSGKPLEFPLTGEAKHAFVERVDQADANGAASRVHRSYEVATSKTAVRGEGNQRELSKDRRLAIVVRDERQTIHACPDGPWTRGELELVAEHFDTLGLPGLLPGKEINPGESWSVGAEAVQQACQFEGVLKHDLKGTLVSAKDGIAEFKLSGTAEGLELGRVAKVAIEATGKFDIAAGRLVELAWTQVDRRELGSAVPATELTATISLRRELLKEEPKSLAEVVRAKLPNDKIPDAMLALAYDDAENPYRVLHGREWYFVGRNSSHAMLRFVDKGEFHSQATISSWKPAAKGEHTPPKEFKDAVNKVPGWEPSEILFDEEVKVTDHAWLYRYGAKGKRDGAVTVQTFYFVAAADGQQAIVSFFGPPEKMAKFEEPEKAFIGKLEFRKGK